MGYQPSRLRAVARALGDSADPFGVDFYVDGDGSGLEDPRAAYMAWAAAVKQAGGVVATAPHVPGSPAAARYPVAVVFPNAPAATLSAAFHSQPDDWSSDGRYVYYIAPDAVLHYTSGDITAPQSVPGESAPPNPKWYDDLLKYGKYAAVGVGVLVLLNVASYVPRPRR